MVFDLTTAFNQSTSDKWFNNYELVDKGRFDIVEKPAVKKKRLEQELEAKKATERHLTGRIEQLAKEISQLEEELKD